MSAALLDAVDRYLQSVKDGLLVIATRGVGSTAFRAVSDQNAAALDDVKAALGKARAERERSLSAPRVVCLCGSTRFKQAFIEANFRETMAGKIVLSVGLYSHADAHVYTPSPAEKAALDELHFRKIDRADEVLVLDCPKPRCTGCGEWHVWEDMGGTFGWSQACLCVAAPASREPYIGASTRNEIAYAERLGKPVRYLSREGGAA